MKSIRWSTCLLYLVLIAYTLITLLPFAWAFSTSFKSLAEISTGDLNLIPKHFTLANYQTIFVQEPLFGRWLMNSAIAAICITLLNLLLTQWQVTLWQEFNFQVIKFGSFSSLPY